MFPWFEIGFQQCIHKKFANIKIHVTQKHMARYNGTQIRCTALICAQIIRSLHTNRIAYLRKNSRAFDPVFVENGVLVTVVLKPLLLLLQSAFFANLEAREIFVKTSTPANFRFFSSELSKLLWNPEKNQKNVLTSCRRLKSPISLM